MSIGILNHSGFISSIHKDTLTPFYVTTQENEIINFQDQNNNSYSLNSLTVEANATDLFIQILPSEYCVHIPAGSSLTIDYCRIQQIKVLGLANQNIKWFGLYY